MLRERDWILRRTNTRSWRWERAVRQPIRQIGLLWVCVFISRAFPSLVNHANGDSASL